MLIRVCSSLEILFPMVICWNMALLSYFKCQAALGKPFSGNAFLLTVELLLEKLTN